MVRRDLILHSKLSGELPDVHQGHTFRRPAKFAVSGRFPNLSNARQTAKWLFPRLTYHPKSSALGLLFTA